MSQTETENFVTVVSVGTDEKPSSSSSSSNDDISNKDTTTTGYVTVLTIGDKETNGLSKTVTEEVLVYRLPGERLGFGLKFEGGTKASEFVKRLFIQSCAPDSPASRVTSSWGQLTEGDEVLEIDSIPVSTMTRIDCVRCLKDSNVVIKLLVRHNKNNNFDNNNKSETTTTTTKTKSVEDLPLVISAEKKRTPPPPPPVPPRKIPRKLFKHHSFNGKKDLQEDNNPIPPSRHTITSNETNGTKAKKFQSPRSSGRFNSPDIPRRDRRFSDGSLGPPDAEVYVDLFSQESTQSLSESDDTSSTISTVVDRFGSFPTTTTSSFAGSLPSTPTAIQKQLDLSNLLNTYDDDETVFVKHINQTTINKIEENHDKNNSSEDGPLQPPSCFQDAPLSYGNEDMRIAHETDLTDKKQTMNCSNNKKYDGIKINNITEDVKLSKKPPVPPRARDNVNINNTVEMKKDPVHDENMNISNLPRLVDFVPKSSSTCDNNNKENIENRVENNIEIMKVFLDIERQENHNVDYDCINDIDNIDVYNNGMDIYSSKWSLTSQLATIGEVEEELSQEFQVNRPIKSNTPIVIVENADSENDHKATIIDTMQHSRKDIDGSMEIPPNGSRLPPDGHEFPDQIETSCKTSLIQPSNIIESQPKENKIHKIFKSFESITLSQTETNSSLNKVPIQKTNSSNLNKTSSMSNSDLRPNNNEKHNNDIIDASPIKNLHTHNRSQSLIDMSALDKQKTDKWSTMVEQRKNRLSKLRGLVIPEHSSTFEVDKTSHVNIPLIKSKNTADFESVAKLTSSVKQEQQPLSNIKSFDLSLPSAPWASNNSFPKYSPAFKRKSLQLYSTNTKSEMNSKIATNKQTKSDVEDLRIENLSDPPKSLESITSPTRSDCSFDYVSSSKKQISTNKMSTSHSSKSAKDLTRSEDESDNDSALSSSQSSYISRCSPPSSPTNDFEHMYNKNDEDKCNTQCRMLKPYSVEAINRKNILASAKCRSGRDLKVGSPVIRRKYEENEENDEKEKKIDTTTVPTTTNDIQKTIPEAIPDETAVEKEVTISEKHSSKENSVCLNGTSNISKEKVIPTVNKVMRKTTSPTPTKVNSTETNGNRQFVREVTRSEYLRYNKEVKPLSVNALKKNFENIANESSTVPAITKSPQNIATNKLVKLNQQKTENKVTSEIKKINKVTKKVEDVKVKEKELPVVKEIQKEKAIKSNTVVLNLDNVGSNLGITLAGGSDYENKDITIHRIRYGSLAYQDGRLKRGDKIVYVNEKSTKGLTHAEAVELLKQPITKYEIVIEEECNVDVPSNSRRKSSLLSNPESTKGPAVKVCEKKATNVISLMKDSGGLGFSIEGGKDSPQGDVPLLIKKIFQGGAADKSGLLFVGDELLAINDINFTNLSRIEAWTLMKKIPEGSVNIHVYR